LTIDSPSIKYEQHCTAMLKLAFATETRLRIQGGELICEIKTAPASDFPVEIVNGMNRDPALKDDYLTVFTPEGSYLVDDNPAIVKRTERKIGMLLTADYKEDGNVDFCRICKNTGGHYLLR
jgi:hypothetical protein